jgi:hypothetical protein
MKWMLLPLFVIALSGCQGDNTYQYYCMHADAMTKALKACRALPASDAATSLSCMNANNAYQDTALLYRELVNDPQAFGQTILAQEAKLAALRSAARTATPAEKFAAKQAVNTQRELIERYLAVCKEAGE